MHAFLAPAQSAHAPQTFLHQGVLKPSPEAPERIAILKDAAQAAGCTFATPPDAGIAPIAAVHSSEYIGFLRTIHARWSALDGAAPEVIPNIHPRTRADSYPTSPVGQAGYHQADTACPIGPHTWDAAYASAQSAIAAADAVASGAPHAYALCRPPG
ncbi:MAG: histone deacetylase family protein, partial [Roseovarius confluentis]